MTTDPELVDIAYRGILNRPAEPTAVENWVARLSNEPKTRLLASLVASPEFARRYQRGLDENQLGSAPPERSPDPMQLRLLGLLRLLSPKRAIGVPKIRLGRPRDGGYVMLDDLSGIKAVVSCGVGTEFSWDSDIADRGIEVHQIDYSIEAPRRQDGKFRFHKLRLGSEPNDGAITFHDIALIVGKKRSILKVDVEGAEWAAFAAVEPADLLPYSQIIVEFHDLTRALDPETIAIYEAAAQRIADGFQCVHVHGNNFRSMQVVAGIPIPDVLEVTFASRRDYAFAEIDETFPTPLDAANNPKAPDFMLGSFRFS